MADGMIAIVDENGNSKMALGHFYNTVSGQNYYGVLADVIGGTLLIGLELNITCPDINGGVAQFKVDSTGCFLNNSRFYLQSDSGGRIGIDPVHGIFAGTSSLFTTTDTGTVQPTFLDSNGDIQFDDDGMPLNTNFMVDINTGNVYIRGKIVAESGWFRGIVAASDFQDHNGNSMLTSDGKFDSNYLDLGNIQLDGETGDIDMSGNITLGGNINITGNINWGSSNSPVVVQYSVNGTSGWHNTYSISDYFARYSYDGGTTWTSAIKLQGKDGKDGSDGSDADVTRQNIQDALSYSRTIGSSFLAMDSVGSPIIYGGKIYGSEIYAGGDMTSGGVVGTGSTISLTSSGIGLRNDSNGTNLEITSTNIPGIGNVTALFNQSAPLLLNAQVIMAGHYLGSDSAIGWEVNPQKTCFFGNVDFSNANTKGLYYTFV